jgi:hypothetical protein
LAVVVVVAALCSAAWAGTLTVKAIDGGAPVAGATVEVEPCGMTGATNADGKWSETVPTGDQQVIVWTDAGGTLRGAIADITMPGGNHDISVNLVDAVWVQNYYPLAVGNKWLYDYQHRERGGASYRTTWQNEVLRTVTMGADTAVVVEGHKGGTPQWEEIRAANAEGFAMYTQEHGPDEIKFDPPLRFGPLMPMGYEWVATATAHHSTGAPDTPVTFRATFDRFQDVHTPAGMFSDCARIAAKFEWGPEVNELIIWLDEGVGPVREIERNTERTNTKILQEYTIRGVPVRPIRPMRPIRPTTPMKPH